MTALTARCVRYNVGLDLIYQPGPSPGIMAHSSPSRFSNNYLASFCSLSLSHLPTPPPSCLRPRCDVLPSLPAPVSRRTDTTRLVEKRFRCAVRFFYPHVAEPFWNFQLPSLSRWTMTTLIEDLDYGIVDYGRPFREEKCTAPSGIYVSSSFMRS